MKSSPRRQGENRGSASPSREAGPATPPRSWQQSGNTSPRRFSRRWRDRDAETPFDRPPPAARGVGELLPDVLAGLGGDPLRLRLVQLWRHWEMVLGPELAPLARPLGHHGESLLIGAEDAMLMQELHLQSGEILERVNAFMEGAFFSCVKVSLCFQRTELDGISAPPVPPAVPVERPRLTGDALNGMRPDSPVARCYARYVALSRARGAQKQDFA